MLRTTVLFPEIVKLLPALFTGIPQPRQIHHRDSQDAPLPPPRETESGHLSPACTCCCDKTFFVYIPRDIETGVRWSLTHCVVSPDCDTALQSAPDPCPDATKIHFQGNLTQIWWITWHHHDNGANWTVQFAAPTWKSWFNFTMMTNTSNLLIDSGFPKTLQSMGLLDPILVSDTASDVVSSWPWHIRYYPLQSVQWGVTHHSRVTGAAWHTRCADYPSGMSARARVKLKIETGMQRTKGRSW